MSPFARGLLGGVAQGLTQTASMLFADSIAAKKEERLAKIADRNYQRDRADQLSDIEAQRTFQNDQRIASQNFGATQNTADRTFQQQLADSKLDAFSSFKVGEDGVVYGLNARGESQAISGFKQELISFGDLTRLKTSATQELSLYPDDARSAELKTFVTSLDNAINTKLQMGGYGTDGPDPAQVKIDGRKLFGEYGTGAGIDSVEFDGVTYSGAQLQKLRDDFKRDYGDVYGQLYGR
jgi:hypothetical protein